MPMKWSPSIIGGEETRYLHHFDTRQRPELIAMRLYHEFTTVPDCYEWL